MNRAVIHIGNSLDVLKTLESESIQTCVTSPPYWGLRDYGTAKWVGGSAECDHNPDSTQGKTGQRQSRAFTYDGAYKTVCSKCGALRQDKQLGLEETPEEYVINMVELFREVRRVLRDDGTLWLNLGDTYAGSGKVGRNDTDEDNLARRASEYGTGTGKGSKVGFHGSRGTPSGFKPKDLVGIPWMVAFALRADGWYLRQDIIWHKPNPMPESVTDRCTKSHEYIFLLSKSRRYYYDHDAIRQPLAEKTYTTFGTVRKDLGNDGLGLVKSSNYSRTVPVRKPKLDENGSILGANKRSVWTVATKPYVGAHFATFPPELIEPCILAGAPKGGAVLDPFSGAGTTGLVAMAKGRGYAGIELSGEYAQMSKERIESAAPLFNQVELITHESALEKAA